MEAEKQKKINPQQWGRAAILVCLLLLTVASVTAVGLGVTPNGFYSILGMDYSRCHGSDGCFAFCNVGNGDSSIVYTEQVMGMVDFGLSDYAYSLSDKVLQQTDQPLDFAVISHPHRDHIGGFAVMVDRVGISRLYIREYTEDQLEDYEDYLQILAIAQANNIPVIHPAHGSSVTIGDIGLTFYSPSFFTQDENERCLIVRATVGEKRCLYMGDSGYVTEAYLLESHCDLQADVLKVGHHGSDHGTSKALLQAVNPTCGIICVGYNSYGHPSVEVARRLNEAKIPFYRTDGYQQIICSVTDQDLSIQYV